MTAHGPLFFLPVSFRVQEQDDAEVCATMKIHTGASSVRHPLFSQTARATPCAYEPVGQQKWHSQNHHSLPSLPPTQPRSASAELAGHKFPAYADNLHCWIAVTRLTRDEAGDEKEQTTDIRNRSTVRLPMAPSPFPSFSSRTSLRRFHPPVPQDRRGDYGETIAGARGWRQRCEEWKQASNAQHRENKKKQRRSRSVPQGREEGRR